MVCFGYEDGEQELKKSPNSRTLKSDRSFPFSEKRHCVICHQHIIVHLLDGVESPRVSIPVRMAFVVDGGVVKIRICFVGVLGSEERRALARDEEKEAAEKR